MSAVADNESLARFVYESNKVRWPDLSPKPEAFMPDKKLHLSIFRHLGLTESELTNMGHQFGQQRSPVCPYYGRIDFQAQTVYKNKLYIEPTATPRNHANIKGWPLDKPTQKILAQEIAKKAAFFPSPSSSIN